MRVKQSKAISAQLLAQMVSMGAALARLWGARNVTQQEAALRAGISHNSA